jgi:hypothetical protein
MSVTDIQYSLKRVVSPLDIVHLGDDGILRAFNTSDFTVHHALPLTTSQAIEYARSIDSDISANFAGVNGYDVPEEQHHTPSAETVAQLKDAIERTREEMEKPSIAAKPEGTLEGRPMLSCHSYLCVFTATFVRNCCLHCAVASGSLGKCIAPFC